MITTCRLASSRPCSTTTPIPVTYEVGLSTASDEAVWQYAARHGFTIVTKDADFHQRSFLFGHPPKVVWIRAGNCSTATIETLLRRYHDQLHAFATEPDSAFLTLE